MLSWTELPYQQRNGIIRYYEVRVCQIEPEGQCEEHNATAITLELSLHPHYRAFYCFGREGEVRLADGPSSREGRVDICVDGIWFTPCQDSWGIEETRVVCRELGFCQQGGSLVTGQSYQDYIPGGINKVNCTGDEATLRGCSVTSNCGSGVGAGVSCYSTPNRPTNVEITGINSSSIQVSWLPPDMSNCTDVNEYRITCHDYFFCGYYYLMEEIPRYSLNVMFHDRNGYNSFESCPFYCCVSGNNNAGEGLQNCVYGPIPAPPRNVTVQPSQTSLLIEWMEPEQVYGEFDAYYVVCGTQGAYTHSITETAINITGLSVFTRYECCVTMNVYYSIVRSTPNCANATTAPDIPTVPLAVNITELTFKSIQLEWSRPQPINGIISHYTITCLQANGTIVSLNTTADGLETVSNLQPLTNYTCCISATNQVGEGNDTCVDARTKRGPPTEPQEVATVSAYTNGITLTWTEPAKSYGQAILFYSINCTSAHHNAEIQRAYNTSVNVSGLIANTNYTCCVSAENSVGVGLHRCIVVMTTINTEQQPPSDNSQGNLVTIVSAGTLVAVLLLLGIVITCITCCCCYTRKMNKQVTLKSSQRGYYCFGREGEVRLADGPSSREGRVDICVNRRWYTPCQDNWEIEETRVVCRELGFCQQGGSLVTGQSYQRYIPWDVNEVNCTGDEATLSNCSVIYPSSNCDTFVGAGVSCYSIPNIPTNVEITGVNLNPYSIQVTWSPPDMSNCTDVDRYRIVCYDHCFFYLTEIIVHSLNATIQYTSKYGIFDSCTFSCCVSGNNNAGQGPQNCVEGPIPTPPRNLTVQPSQTTLLIEWMEPEQVYGEFDTYYVVCGTQGAYTHSITETAVNITGLSVFTRYECCVTMNVYFLNSIPNCLNVTTAPAVNITGITYKSIQLEWSRPQPINGIISYYTTTCLQLADGTIMSLNTTADGLDTVSNLRELTNYTCCISATNQVGKGNDTCVDARTERGSPTEPQELVAIVLVYYANGITLTWTEPAERYGQAILFYSINCTSAHHDAEIQQAYTTSVTVYGLIANTNYTCCVSARNSVGVGLHRCIIVMTAIGQPPAQTGSNLVTAVSAGALLAVLLLLCIVITCISCCCCYKRRTSKQVTLQGQQSTADPVYDVPEDIELKEKGSSTLRSGRQNNDTSRRHVYKEEVELRYEKPVLASSGGTATNKKQREKKPMMLIASPSITQPGQQSSEKIYQPLIPPKTYKEQEVSAYQDLAFETRDAGTDMANNSEGQYEPIKKNDEDDQYEPLSFGGGGASQEGAYQPLSFQREDDNTYETIQTTTTRT
ncbi:phosphatidylinositol phosphatase PTPRQ-like isoform X3 [Halichondria panicea]|uniref:phosphatidylinositol phosphatase PTPRQ-like isoform X3 n=1 Tax=Halichondria panicea TaxID=6063 RepID=UPI00312B46B8